MTIAVNAATGNLAAIPRDFGTLNSLQTAVLGQLPKFSSSEKRAGGSQFPPRPSPRGNGYPVAITQEAWYAYGNLNQVVVSNGQLSGKQVILKQGDNSYGVSYDAVGNAVSQQRWEYQVAGNWALKSTGHSYSLRGQATQSLGDGYTTRYVCKTRQAG